MCDENPSPHNTQGVPSGGKWATGLKLDISPGIIGFSDDHLENQPFYLFRTTLSLAQARHLVKGPVMVVT